MSIQFTPQQERAVYSQGNALLVSAAAGSGKTAVLVQRVLDRISRPDGRIDRMMIMTFTTAAAEEMRQKIKKALDRKIRDEGGNDHLLRQSALVDSARIGTVHSICLDLITRHFEKLDLDPRCRLMDEARQEDEANQAIEQLLEDLYGRKEPEIKGFLECYATGRNDDELKKVLKKGLDFLENLPLADWYIHQALAPYGHREEGLFACFREDGLYRFIQDGLGELRAEYETLYTMARQSSYLSSFPKLLAFLAEEQGKIQALVPILEKRDYDSWQQAIQGVAFETLNWTRLTEKDPDPQEKDLLNKLRDDFKKHFQAFAKNFPRPEAQELEALAKQGELLKTYFSLCRQLQKSMAEERRRNGWITYGDMEQLTVQLLVDPAGTPENPLPTELALALREEYDEIVVDEFQDTNLTQDLIFRALSKDGTNLFMVGDLKQSIYRFRGAEPTLFEEKRKTFSPFSDLELKAPTVLELTANFRSHPGVLDFCNRVFEEIMSPTLGGVSYDEREKLSNGAEFLRPQERGCQLHWVLPQRDRQDRLINGHLQRARYGAQLIRRMVDEKEPVLLPGKGERAATYGDFAILLRTTAGKADIYERELRRLGIPTINQNPGECFFDLPEVQDLIAYLLVLNNPYDDIALVSLLYSPFFGISVGELAEMRVRTASLFDNIKTAALGENPRAKEILGAIEGFRDRVNELYVYDLIQRIYQETGIFAHYAGTPGGAEKIANLELLAEDARTFEKEGYRGLFAFVEHLRISQSKTQNGARLDSSANCVKIMSIHKSKGLEFPICILPDPDRSITERDLSEPILLHSRLGAALEEHHPELFLRNRSLAQKILADQIRADGVGEEERILYVGLTRAVSKNILLLGPDEKKAARWMGEGILFQGKPPRWFLKDRAPSYSHWLMALLGYAKEGQAIRAHLGIQEPSLDLPSLEIGPVIIAQGAGVTASAAEEKKESVSFNGKAFRQRLDWVYPHEKNLGLPIKLSVSELKGMRQRDPDGEMLLEEKVRLKHPRFASKFQLQGNEMGNALHQALQFSDFSALMKDPQKELDRMEALHFITPRQRELIPQDKILRFTQSPVFQELLSADWYRKEERFLFPMKAQELFGADQEGEIMIQGVLDCYWVKNGEAVILDYKTDQVQNPEELVRRYQVQMDLYEEALKRTKGLRVLRKIIYSFHLEQTIIL